MSSLNSIQDLSAALTNVKEHTGVVEVYADVARQLETQQGGLYRQMLVQFGAHVDVVEWCYATLPSFGEFYQDWAQDKYLSEQKRKERMKTALKWGGILALGFGKQIIQDFNSGKK
jgi:hypothetical protein